MANLQDIKETDLILVGKTGHGKSSTANTILGEKWFHSSASSNSVTRTRNTKWKSFENRILTVVDTPGLEDTKFKDEEDQLRLVAKEVESIIVENPKGFDACLIVMKFAVRFTKYEQCCIKAIKSIFGDKVVKKHCIIIMTGGDDFEADFEDSNLSFSDWCEQETGDFKSLLEECGGRIILFNNRKKGDDRISQVQELLKMVDKIGGKYTDKHFQKARKSREIMMLNAKLPGISDATNNEIINIQQKLHEVEKNNGFMESQELNTLHTEAKALLDKLVVQDNKTGVLSGLIKTVESTISSISESIEVRKRVAQEIERRGTSEMIHKLEQLHNRMALMALRSELEREVYLLMTLGNSNSKSECKLM